MPQMARPRWMRTSNSPCVQSSSQADRAPVVEPRAALEMGNRAYPKYHPWPCGPPRGLPHAQCPEWEFHQPGRAHARLPPTSMSSGLPRAWVKARLIQAMQPHQFLQPVHLHSPVAHPRAALGAPRGRCSWTREDARDDWPGRRSPRPPAAFLPTASGLCGPPSRLLRLAVRLADPGAIHLADPATNSLGDPPAIHYPGPSHLPPARSWGGPHDDAVSPEQGVRQALGVPQFGRGEEAWQGARRRRAPGPFAPAPSATFRRRQPSEPP